MIVFDQRDKTRAGMAQALLARAGRDRHDGANPWRGYSLPEMARAAIERAGGRTAGATSSDIAAAALSRQPTFGMQTTSDLPNVLEDAMHKMVLEGFGSAAVTHTAFTKTGSVSDLREWSRMVPGLLGNLLPANEHGEYEQIPIPDGEKNSIQAKRFGRIIAITPDVIINDDLAYIDSQANAAGQMGARTIEQNVYALLESNPVLEDGYALFSSEHGNVAASGGAPDQASIQAADTAMNAQKAPQVSGEQAQLLDLFPSTILAHRSRKSALTTLNSAQEVYDAMSSEKLFNAVNGMFERIVTTARLAPAPWYVFADPDVAPVIEVVFLNGSDEPVITQSEHFASGGIRWRVELPQGVGAVDYRGGYKDPGA